MEAITVLSKVSKFSYTQVLKTIFYSMYRFKTWGPWTLFSITQLDCSRIRITHLITVSWTVCSSISLFSKPLWNLYNDLTPSTQAVSDFLFLFPIVVFLGPTCILTIPQTPCQQATWVLFFTFPMLKVSSLNISSQRYFVPWRISSPPKLKWSLRLVNFCRCPCVALVLSHVDLHHFESISI